MPGATVEDARTRFIAFTSCDPGAAAATPAPETITAAEQLLALRGELTAEIAEQGVHEDTARCSARLLARDPASGERAARGGRLAHTGVAAATRGRVRRKRESRVRADPTAGLHA